MLEIINNYASIQVGVKRAQMDRVKSMLEVPNKLLLIKRW